MKFLVVFFALIAISQGTFLKFLWTSPEEDSNNEKEEESSTTEQTPEETYSFHPIPLPVPTTYVVKPPETVYEEDDTNPNFIPPPNFYQVPHIVNTFIPPKNNIYVSQNYQQQAYPVLVKNPAIPPHQFYAGNNIILRNPQQWAYPPNFIPVSDISNEETQLIADQIEQSKDNHLSSQGDVSQYENKYPMFVNHPSSIPENQFNSGNNDFLPNGQQWPYPRFLPGSSISNEEAHLGVEQTDIPADIYQSIPIEENSSQYENFPPLVNRPTIPDNYFYRGNNIILPNAQQLSYSPNFVPVGSQTNEETHSTSDEAHYTSEDFSLPVEHNRNQYDNYKLLVNKPAIPDNQFLQGHILSGDDQQWPYPPNFIPVSSNTNEETHLTSDEARYTSEDFSVPVEHNPNQYDNYKLLVNNPAIPNNQFYQGNILSGDDQQWQYSPNFIPASSTGNEQTHLTVDQAHQTEDISITSEHDSNQYESNQPANAQQWSYQPNTVPADSSSYEGTHLTSDSSSYEETHLTSDGSSYEETHLTSDQTDLPAEEMELSVNENESSHENVVETSHESSTDVEQSKDEAVINFNNIGSDNNNNEYYHSYTLDDGTTVVEEGNLVEKDGSVVLVKHGEYQRQESDGKISSVKWIADESGFRITE